jgi:hypothetical protein
MFLSKGVALKNTESVDLDFPISTVSGNFDGFGAVTQLRFTGAIDKVANIKVTERQLVHHQSKRESYS